MLMFFNTDKTPWGPNQSVAPVLVAEGVPAQAVIDLIPKARGYKKFQSLEEAKGSTALTPTPVFFCQHRYTSNIDLFENVLCGQGSYPPHEYDILVADIPTQAVLDILPKAKAYRRFSNPDEASSFYKANFGDRGRYPSKQEFETSASAPNPYPPPKVGPYEPD